MAPVGGHITAENGQKMGPRRPKWAQKGPKQPKMGPNAPKMTPNLGKRLRYVKLAYHPVFGPPTPGWQPATATLQLKKWPKMGPWRPKWAHKGPTATSNKQVGFN